MTRLMTLAAALLIMVTGMAVAPQADAGLFNRNDCCCKPERQGLFAKLKAKRAAKDCCEPCEPVCEPEPVCCEAPAPAPCGCEAPAPAPCGCEAPAPEPCGCAAAPAPCEVEVVACAAPAEPACASETTDCSCLNRRQLRRAQRKGECCDAEPKTCYSGCSAPVSTCGCEVAAATVADCGCGGEVIIETAPAEAPEAAGEEAAPEAPEATT